MASEIVAMNGSVLSLTLGADDGIRTRDPHLGKVVRLPGHKSVTPSYQPVPASSCHLVPRVARP